MISLIVVKITGAILRLLNKGGSLPGLMLTKKDEHIIKKFKLPKNIILITGTNGKTSLTNQVAEIFRLSGQKVVTNTEGNNMYNGVASLLARHSTLNFEVKCDVIVLEIDEMSLAKVMKDMSPMLVVVNNLFRDQLDRVGEMENLILRLQGAMSDYKGALLLNGDDPNVARLGLSHPYSTYFGVDQNALSTMINTDAREGRICPTCQEFIEYKFYNYSHLGAFTCPGCAFGQHHHDFYVSKFDVLQKSVIINEEVLLLNDITLYLVYNAAVLYSVTKLFELNTKELQAVLSDYNVSKGRNESFVINSHKFFLALVKNPVGFNETIKYTLSKLDQEHVNYVIAVNDNDPDGIDVSWLYDTQFELLLDDRIARIICSGTRAYDLAIRLKIAGFDTKKLKVIPKSEEAIDYAVQTKIETHVLSCYTQLQAIRSQLASLDKGGAK